MSIVRSSPGIRLGVLDQVPIRRGGTSADAIHASVELAALTDRLGFSRYWVAEHHSSETFACATPEILVAQLAAMTSRIRVGTGGVMLLHYSALKVAESFRMLETLHPGRIDMGFGRAPGGSAQAVDALARGQRPPKVEDYPHHVADVLRFIADRVPADHPAHGLRAVPSGARMPTPWLLASSLGSALQAAEMGLALSFAHFISPEEGPDIVDAYREHFKPSPWLRRPKVNVAVPAICAQTDAEAQQIAMSRHMMLLGHGRDRGLGVPSIAEALAFEYSAAERAYIEAQRDSPLIGAPARVRGGLVDLVEAYAVDELLILTVTHDPRDRARSYARLADAFGLTAC